MHLVLTPHDCPAESPREHIRRLWKQMCEYDRVDAKECFVVFSLDNPFTPKYDRAVIDFIELDAMLE